MKILYISNSTSDRLIGLLYKETGKNLGFAALKFHRLLARGFVCNNVEFQTLTGLPISRDISPKIWWNMPRETEDGVLYKYIPFVNYPGIRQICLFLYSFFYTLFWGLTDKKNKTIVCDVLNISICMGSLWASKIVGIKSVGIMTDMPGLMVSRNTKTNKNKLKGLIPKINKSYLTSFSSYVFLTEQMNTAVNLKKRPYIVMEGLVDEKMAEVMGANGGNGETANERILLYAGGLHERYGLKTLVEAFIKLPNDDVRLHLYGNGPFVDELTNNYCKKDERIVYHGVVNNETVVKAELKATLLINPRPTNEEFTQYSFPSKNMEYMVSGTPILTTKLPGMPEEYYPYIYMFDNETVEGYADTLKYVLSKPNEELQNKGKVAKEFVLQKKNNVFQTKRIMDLIQL